MAKLPFIKWFPNDWLAEPTLRLCSLAARGLWIDMLSLMHLSPRRGVLLAATGSPLSLDQLARAVGCSSDEASRLLAELITSGVCTCTADGTIYNRRMVRDEHKRSKCADAGQIGGLRSAQRLTLKGQAEGGAEGEAEGRPKLPEARGQRPEARPPYPPPGAGGGRVVVAAGELSSPGPTRSADESPETPTDPRRDVGQGGPETARGSPRTAEFDPEAWVVTPEPFAALVVAWDAARLPGAGKVHDTPTRRGLFEQRQADDYWRRHWRAAVERLGRSGKARGLDPSFRRGVWMTEFLRHPDFVARVLEGEFDDAGGSAASGAVDDLAAARRSREALERITAAPPPGGAA